jgi:hypothetical protein
VSFLNYYLFIWLIKIAPFIPDDFIADQKLNKVLFSVNEVSEQFITYFIADLIRLLFYFKPISITAYNGKP